ncbi:MAG: nucleotidyltransferase domain-containing protein [Thermodesulfobacteriota bacterium]|nr:nucleotidyltransferase domain-containing protein [Thermodesulfobacteriota bacterium]
MIFSIIKIPHKEKIISSIVGVEPNVKKIFLFGSRARQDNKNPFCDIDIGVLLERKLSLLQLGKLNDVIDQINTLYTIQVVDFTDRKDGFSKEALKTVKVIYEKK